MLHTLHEHVMFHCANRVASSRLKGCKSLLALVLLTVASSCRNQAPPPVAQAEPETLARTEFTRRVENFFEYVPLKAGQPSQFLIHLTDLQDGTPVEKADVVLSARIAGAGREVVQTKARAGKVTGIYVAELAVPEAGRYDIEFQIHNPKLDERLVSGDFQVE